MRAVDCPASHPPPARQGRALALAIAITLSGVLPAFLVTGMSVQVRGDLGLTESRLGLAVTMYFTCAALGSTLAGRLTERIGAATAVPISAALATVSLLGLAGATAQFAALVGFLMIGGFGSAMAHPSANLTLARDVAPERQGLAFGIKQAAVPAGSFLGGLAVPVLALTLGWRSAIALGAALVAVLLVVSLTSARSRLVRVSLASRRPQATISASRPSLFVLCASSVFGTAAGNSLATFLAVAAVGIGIGEAAAGMLVAAASAAAICMRIVVGIVADRLVHSHLSAISVIIGSAVIAFATLTFASLTGRIGLFMIAAVVGFGGSWGWHGLMTYAIVRRHPDAPAYATGMLQAGTAAGGVVGPVTMGVIIERVSYAAAWATATMLLLVAIAMVLSVARADRSRAA